MLKLRSQGQSEISLEIHETNYMEAKEYENFKVVDVSVVKRS